MTYSKPIINLQKIENLEFPLKQIFDKLRKLDHYRYLDKDRFFSEVENDIKRKIIKGWGAHNGKDIIGIILYKIETDKDSRFPQIFFKVIDKFILIKKIMKHLSIVKERINIFLIYVNEDKEFSEDKILYRLLIKILDEAADSHMSCIYYTIHFNENYIKILSELGFKNFIRTKMKLKTQDISNTSVHIPLDYSIIKWKDCYYNDIVHLLYNSNLNNIDSPIMFEFSSIRSTRRFLNNLIYHTKNGHLDINSSFIALKNKFPCGVVLLNRIQSDIDFLVYIAVDDEHRKKGLGKMLLISSILNARDAIVKEIDAYVTNSNKHVYTMYMNIGFKPLFKIINGVYIFD